MVLVFLQGKHGPRSTVWAGVKVGQMTSLLGFLDPRWGIFGLEHGGGEGSLREHAQMAWWTSVLLQGLPESYQQVCRNHESEVPGAHELWVPGEYKAPEVAWGPGQGCCGILGWSFLRAHTGPPVSLETSSGGCGQGGKHSGFGTGPLIE